MNTTTRPITVAVFALGGEGGGVLAEWIVTLAERNGYRAQMTSVPGVAQRTGATVYYLEILPLDGAGARAPVFALMPTPGDVDIVIASELMEAARAVERGLVTKDRTTLVMSTHRVFTMTERTAVADARIDTEALLDACRATARKLVAFDMQETAARHDSPISAVMFGALSRAGVLPFQEKQFESAVEQYGVGVATSLRAFRAALTAGEKTPEAGIAATSGQIEKNTREWQRQLSPETRQLIEAAFSRVAAFQDRAYAELFLDRLERFTGPGADESLISEVGRQLALAMTYDDTVRVAELKIKPERFTRVRGEVKAKPEEIVEIAEFMHPRTQEVAETLPAPIGRWLLRTSWARNFVGLFTKSGRTVKTTSLRGFLLLYFLASLKRFRRSSLRFVNEEKAILAWLDTVAHVAAKDTSLAVEVARARSIVKGYSDTYERGVEKFGMVLASLPQLEGRTEARARFGAIVDAALNTDDIPALKRTISEKIATLTST